MAILKLILFISIALPSVVQSTEVRLNGSRHDTGIVEIKDNGTWVAMSAATIRATELPVICRSAGLPWSIPRYWGSFNAGDNITYKVLDIRCQGNETNIDQCTHNGITRWAPTITIVSCKELQFRLRGGGGNHGIVEVNDAALWYPVWRPICARPIFNRDWATVMCSKLGLNSSHALNIDAGRYPKSSQLAFPLEMNCDGAEDKANCSVNRVFGAELCNKYTSVYQQAAVLCSDTPVKYRLKDGKTNRTGRLEAFVNDTWGPVCSKSFSNRLAVVACKSLKLPSTDARYILGRYNGGTSTPSMSGLGGCMGNETSLEECFYTLWVPAPCQHYVGISCGIAHEGQLRVTGGYDEISGRLEVYQNSSWGSFCYSGFDPSAAEIACKSVSPYSVKHSKLVSSRTFSYDLGITVVGNITCIGNESNLLDCPHTLSGRDGSCWGSPDAGVTCDYGDVEFRMEDGVLLMLRNMEWGTVCDTSFNDVDASVACKTFNYSSSFAQRKYPSSGQNRSGRIWYEGIKCRGNESNLLDCGINEWGPAICSHADDVVISCQDINTVPINYTMRGDPLDNVGYVLMKVDGQWGSVCDDGFDEKEAQVACRSIGRRTDGARLVTASAFSSMTIFAPPRKMWLDEVKCNGTEASLLDCQHNYIGENDCTVREAVIVYCGPSTDDDYAVRLVGSSDVNSGRVEMKRFGQWGSVCYGSFTNGAEVVCRQLSLPSSGAINTMETGNRNGLTWSDHIVCYSYESSLAECQHYYYGTEQFCTPVGVECKASSVPDYSYHYFSSGFPVGAIVGVVIAGVALVVFVISMIAYAVGRQRQRNGAASTLPVQYVVPNNGSVGQNQTSHYNPAMFSPPPAYNDVVQSKSSGQDDPGCIANK